MSLVVISLRDLYLEEVNWIDLHCLQPLSFLTFFVEIESSLEKNEAEFQHYHNINMTWGDKIYLKGTRLNKKSDKER